MNTGKQRQSETISGEVRARNRIAILLAVFLLPNVGAMFGGFILDDIPIIVANESVHSLDRIPEIWTSPYWPDRAGLTLYRPLTRTIWAILWVLGNGSPWIFHLANLLAGGTVVILLYLLLRHATLEMETVTRARAAESAAGRRRSEGIRWPKEVAFVAALLFALFPIHTEATTSIIGFSELLSAVFGVGALLCFAKEKRALALLLFALAVFSKESAAALPAIAWILAPRPRRRFIVDGLVAAGIVGAVLYARHAVSIGADMIPAVDNPMALLPASKRVLTALWVQCLYVWKTIVPIELSADYSYKQIPLVMGLHDLRAWAGIVLAIASAIALRRRDLIAAGIATWWILFLPASNLLFPIGTLMGERLAYLPSAGLAIVLAVLLQRPLARKHRRVFLAVVSSIAILYCARTAVRNLDWLDPDHFYPRLVQTSPDSAKTWYFHGAWRAWKGDDEGAVASYDRSIAILPFYTESLQNRANALARLGRLDEAAEGYRQVLRFDPSHRGAAANLSLLQQGIRPDPSRPEL